MKSLLIEIRIYIAELLMSLTIDILPKGANETNIYCQKVVEYIDETQAIIKTKITKK